jgi:hypothetical protein
MKQNKVELKQSYTKAYILLDEHSDAARNQQPGATRQSPSKH